MTFDKTFPLQYYINLGRREDRRRDVQNVFLDAGLEKVQRWGAVDARRVKDARGYESAGRYALALTDRLILREARRRRVGAVMLFEDDVVLHPQFLERFEALELPEDWGIFYLGCQHVEMPEVVRAGGQNAPATVRVKRALDTQAFAVRAPYIQRVMQALKGSPRGRDGKMGASDAVLAELAGEIPMYAAYPNLAWQKVSDSELLGKHYSSYHETGEQRANQHVMEGFSAVYHGGRVWAGLASEDRPMLKETMIDGDAWLEPESQRKSPAELCTGSKQARKVAFLFLTVADVTQPIVWAEYFAGNEGFISVYAHTKQLEKLTSPWLQAALIQKRVETRWGDVSLVRATLALLEAALQDPDNGWFVLVSDACAPIKPFQLLHWQLLRDGRSRMDYETHSEVAAKQAEKAQRAAPLEAVTPRYLRFHPQWWLLNREMAEVVAEDDFTENFQEVFAADELYFGTVLRMKGYPLDARVNRRDVTHASWKVGPHPLTYSDISSQQAADWASGEAFFARKFSAEANLREWRLHLA